MNELITTHLNTFATLIADIKNTETIEYSSTSIEMQLYLTFTELTEEVYELLLGDPFVAAKEMEGGLEKIDEMLAKCCELAGRFSSHPIFESLGLEKDVNLLKVQLIYLLISELDKMKELFTDIKAIPDFKG